jgi:hypothetical protein
VHGTTYEERGDRLVRVVDRTGAVHAELSWTGPDRGDLVRLAVADAVVDGAVIMHPLLGAAHAVGDTAMTAVAWARPTEIPAIAEPGRLPPGAGSAILNTIAILAQRAGVAALRYAGPYPTAALWHTLARSFRCAADEATFTAEALDRALRVARDPIPIDFVSAPHERLAIAGGFVLLRDDVERVVIDGVAYEPSGSPARLIAAAGTPPAGASAARSEPGDLSAPSAGGSVPGSLHCEIWFGDAPYARVATLAPDGSLIEGPYAIPPCESPVIGRAFPAALRAALAELIADLVPAPLAEAARTLCAEHALRWADLGARAARAETGGFAVHAALWDRIAPLGLGRLALALAEALAPVVTAAAVARASRRLPAPYVTVGVRSTWGVCWMKPRSFALLVAIAGTLGGTLGGFGASARADVSVIDNDKTLEVDCAKDPEVSLIGNHLQRGQGQPGHAAEVGYGAGVGSRPSSSRSSSNAQRPRRVGSSSAIRRSSR